MNPSVESPFQSIESAHGFVTLLAAAVAEAKAELAADVERESKLSPSRRLEALRLALYKTERLDYCMHRAGLMLNDLRTCRRLLFGERTPIAEVPKKSPATTNTMVAA